MRYFTVAQAEELIPDLEKIFAAILEIRPKAEAKARMLQKLEEEGSTDAARIALEKGQLDFLAGGINEWFQRIMDLGAFPKGLDPALVDFPYRLGDKEVYLCWRLGEKKITHYHGIEDGYSNRRRLPTRPS